MRNVVVGFVFLLLSPLVIQAQTQQTGWVAAFTTFKLNDEFSVHFDGQLRSTDNLEQLQTILIRPGINFHLTKDFSVTAGYAFIPNRRNIGTKSALLNEHRIWQQALYSHKARRTSLSHRFRFEQRFLPKATISSNTIETSGFDTAYRLRYFVRQIIPLTSHKPFKEGWFLALQNEVFANVGNKSAVNGKVFDQNRLYGAVGYRFPGKIDLEVGYMNQYIQTRSSSTTNHIVQFALYRHL
ncbi:MAG: DUF2490 domain-containing protein [Acidobacteria bacterium]|nr:DUF2490 domain-containing protein [Acidobacteriota bacterium]